MVVVAAAAVVVVVVNTGGDPWSREKKALQRTNTRRHPPPLCILACRLPVETYLQAPQLSDRFQHRMIQPERSIT